MFKLVTVVVGVVNRVKVYNYADIKNIELGNEGNVQVVLIDYCDLDEDECDVVINTLIPLVNGFMNIIEVDL